MAGIDINTRLMMHLDGNNGAKEIVDNGNTGHVVTQVATASLDASVSKFGNTSLFLDGNSDYIEILDSSDWDLFLNNSDTHTISFFVKLSSTSGLQNFINQQAGGGDAWQFTQDDGTGGLGKNTMIFQWDTPGFTPDFTIEADGQAITDNSWHHLAVVIKGTGSVNEVAVYKDGVQISYGSTSENDTVAGTLRIGNDQFGRYVAGNIDEVIIQKSNLFSASPNIGLTDTIQVPLSPHIPDVNTKLLLHMESHDIGGDGGTGVYNIPTFAGTAQIDTSQIKFGDASLFLDGNSDDIRMGTTADFAWMHGKGNTSAFKWTVDCWFKHNLAIDAGFQNIICTEQSTAEIGFAVAIDRAPEVFYLTITRGVASNPVIVAFSANGVAPSDTNWHHLECSYDQSLVSNNAKIFLDGVLVHQQTKTGLTPSGANSSGILTIGRRATGASNYYNGNIDELRISDVVRHTSNFTPPTAPYSISEPSAPRNLTATAISGTEINLDWDVPLEEGDSAITGYKIERESPEDGGFSTIVADTGNTDTDYSDTGLSAFTEYNYRVSAINASGTSLVSSEAKDDTLGAPGVPTNLVSVVNDEDDIDLSWDAPLDDGGFELVGYKIERKNRDDNSFTTIVADTGDTNTTYNDTSFIETSKLIYRISAINTMATGDPSSEHTTGTINFDVDANTELLLHADEGTFKDSSSNDYVASLIGGAGVDGASPKFGVGNYLNSGSGQLRYDNTSLFPGTTSPFTIDKWFKPPASSMFDLKLCVYGQQATVNQSTFFWQIQGTELQFWRYIGAGNDTKIMSANLSWDTNTWYHLAVERRGANGYTMYRDGVIVATSADNSSLFNPGGSGGLSIAGHQNVGFSGHRFDEFRYTKGVARYEGEEFCPPANIYGSPNVGQQDIRFNPIIKRHENVSVGEDPTFDKFSGKHYKNYKKG